MASNTLKTKTNSDVIPTNLRGLYPPIKCKGNGFLEVDIGQKLYFEVSGATYGKPVVVLHGGPGAGCDDELRQFFDPSMYKIVMFDQRGAGRSTPLAIGRCSVDHNTTWDLIDDIEKLRVHLDIAQWQVFGGSWGSTLALAYATTHPLIVTELVLRGVCLWRERDLAFSCGGGPKGCGASSMMYPKEWKTLVKHIPQSEQNDIPKAYYTRMISKEISHWQKLSYARRWNAWGAEISLLRPDLEDMAPASSPDHEISSVLLETHYLVHKGFFDADGWLLLEENISKIRHIPTVIVHGRYDLVCPLVGAYDLHIALPRASYFVVPDAGHSCWEDGIVDKLIRATDKFGKRAAREKKKAVKKHLFE